MKTRYVVSAILSLTVIAASLSATPKMEFVDNSFDFGRVYQGKVVTHSFWIRSTGDDTLRILEVKPGCGCTQIPVTDSILAPGDSVRLGIIFNTRRFSGAVTKRPSIITNASEKRVFLNLYANVLMVKDDPGILSIKPHLLDVSQFGDKQRRKAKFLIENTKDEDVTLGLIDGSGKGFEIRLPDKIKAGETVEGQIIVDEDRIESSFEESITFELDDVLRSRYTLPIERKYRLKRKQ
jgi:hypothetical protein